MFPPLQARWALRGRPSQVVLSGWNAWRAVYGALDIKTGDRFMVVQQRLRALEFSHFLEEVRQTYRGRKIAMVLDESSAHTAKASQRLAAELKIELLWLPIRCPELNPLERLWRTTKSRVCANRQYESLEEQVNSFLEFVQHLSSEESLSTSGVLSPNFWLFKS